MSFLIFGILGNYRVKFEENLPFFVSYTKIYLEKGAMYLQKLLACIRS